jgi:hypothetical protein
MINQNTTETETIHHSSGPGPKRLLPETALQGKQLLKEAWEDYKSRWGSFIWLMIATTILGFLIFLGPSAIFAFLVFVVNEFGGSADDELTAAVSLLALLTGIVLMFVFTAIATMAPLTLAMNKNLHLGFKTSFVHLKTQLPKAGGFIWLLFIQSFLTMIGFLFFIIPGILMAIWWSQSCYVYLKEGKRGMAALKRSYELMRGYGWYYFYMLIPIIFLFLAVIIPSIIIIFLFPISYLVIGLFLIPLTWVYYFHLFERIEGLNQVSARSMISAKHKWMIVGAFFLYHAIFLGTMAISGALWGAIFKTDVSFFEEQTYDMLNEDTNFINTMGNDELTDQEMQEIEAWINEIEAMSDEEFEEYINNFLN